MRFFTLAFAVALLACATMCRPSMGAFTPSGYTHQEYPYTVRYQNQKEQLLMSADWQLDNLTMQYGSMKPKRGADYESTLFLDIDDDGKADDLGTFLTYDLRFEHKKTGSTISVRTVPIELNEKDRELRVLADRLVEQISGGGYDVVQLKGELYATNKERRYAAKILKSAPAKVAGKDAYTTTVDVSNVDRLRVDPQSVEMRVQYVLVRTPFEFKPRMYQRRFPVVMVFSYRSTPADFDAQSADFRDLLSRIAIDDASGFTEGEPAAPPAAAPPTKPREPSVEDASTPSASDAGSALAPEDAATGS